MKINKKKIMISSMICMGISANTISYISANADYMQPEVDKVIQDQNDDKRGFTLQRIDEVTKEGVQGAVYMVTNPSESTVVGYVTTDEDGYGEIKLPNGSYLIQEIKAPEGYENDYFLFPFEINDNTKEHYHILSARTKVETEDNQSGKDESEIQIPKEDGTVDNSGSTDSKQPEKDKESESTVVEDTKHPDKADDTVMEDGKQKDTSEKDNDQKIEKEIEKNTFVNEEINSNKQKVQLDQTKKEDNQKVKDVSGKEKTEKSVDKKHQVESKKEMKRTDRQKRESVQTSDTSNLLLWGFVSIFALCTIVFLSIKKMMKH